jgi:hypothetical protein
MSFSTFVICDSPSLEITKMIGFELVQIDVRQEGSGKDIKN